MEDTIYKRYSNADFIYGSSFKVGLNKVKLAFEEKQEDILMDMWSKSQSELSFEQWKAKVLKGNNKSGNNAKSNVSGADLAHL